MWYWLLDSDLVLYSSNNLSSWICRQKNWIQVLKRGHLFCRPLLLSKVYICIFYPQWILMDSNWNPVQMPMMWIWTETSQIRYELLGIYRCLCLNRVCLMLIKTMNFQLRCVTVSQGLFPGGGDKFALEKVLLGFFLVHHMALQWFRANLWGSYTVFPSKQQWRLTTTRD